MHALALLAAVLTVVCAGTILGFLAGLVPGLHMNNVAAALTAYPAAVLAFLSILGDRLGVPETGLLASCLIASAMTAHAFAECVTSAYVGIPAGDAVSVLPAHRLARAGLGRVAVNAAAEGAMFGLLLSLAALPAVCLLMGPPLNLYSLVRGAMGVLLGGLSGLLVLSEGIPWAASGSRGSQAPMRVLKSLVVFVSAGALGSVVLLTDYNACPIPDVPWLAGSFVPRSSLLLPMFAGLFGVPGLLLSLGARSVTDAPHGPDRHSAHTPSVRDALLSISGGVLVGWIPGVTSGSAAALLMPAVPDPPEADDLEGAARFVWLYSAISMAGAALSVGALFVIGRARSGSMDAIDLFLRMDGLSSGTSSWLMPASALLVAMVTAGVLSLGFLRGMSGRMARVEAFLFSRTMTLASIAFVCSLSLVLTGSRGMLVMGACSCLGLVPPLSGVRRVQLMGCLLVPVTLSLLGLA